jgi:hypothetical protein
VYGVMGVLGVRGLRDVCGDRRDVGECVV